MYFSFVRLSIKVFKINILSCSIYNFMEICFKFLFQRCYVIIFYFFFILPLSATLQQCNVIITIKKDMSKMFKYWRLQIIYTLSIKSLNTPLAKHTIAKVVIGILHILIVTELWLNLLTNNI